VFGARVYSRDFPLERMALDVRMSPSRRHGTGAAHAYRQQGLGAESAADAWWL